MTDAAAHAIAAELERIVTGLIRELGTRARAPGSTLTLAERLALACVADRGELRLGPLARALGTAPATASRTVDGLVSQGLLSREVDPADRRAVRITATARGRRLLAQRRALVADLLSGGIERLDDEQRGELVGQLRQLADHLAAEPLAVGPGR